jgi:hypothetical protein
MNESERLPGCIIICLYFLTIFVWIVIGHTLFDMMDVKSFRQGIGWLILWNVISFVVNSFIMFLGIKLFK